MVQDRLTLALLPRKLSVMKIGHKLNLSDGVIFTGALVNVIVIALILYYFAF